MGERASIRAWASNRDFTVYHSTTFILSDGGFASRMIYNKVKINSLLNIFSHQMLEFKIILRFQIWQNLIWDYTGHEPFTSLCPLLKICAYSLDPD